MVKNFTGDASIRKSTAGRGLADPKGEDGSVGLLNFVGGKAGRLWDRRMSGCGAHPARSAAGTTTATIAALRNSLRRAKFLATLDIRSSTVETLVEQLNLKAITRKESPRQTC